MAEPTNMIDEDQPIRESNQIVSSPGKNYFYEELGGVMAWEQPGGGNGISTNVYLTKVGRVVTLFMPDIVINQPTTANPIQLSAGSPFHIPPRMFPASATASGSNVFPVSVGADMTNFGTNRVLGSMEIVGPAISFKYPAPTTGQLGNFPATGGTEKNVIYGAHFSWLAKSSYNV